MSLVDTETGEVVSLDGIAADIHAQYGRGLNGARAMVESYFAIGRQLLRARGLLPSDKEYGRWFQAQDFGFTTQWANRLCQAAENEKPVRALLESQVSSSGAINFKAAVIEARTAELAERPALHVVDNEYQPLGEHDIFPTIVADPPWQYDNKATRNAAEKQYPTMSMDELYELEIPATENAHLYLWVTNPFMREGLDLCDAWGFKYKGLLTWVKPQFGMGNYFRSATEHVIFGIKGSLPTRRNDVKTWFQSDRQRHSQKPECFYDMVESTSPGPYYEMFSRRRRFGWTTWGNEA